MHELSIALSIVEMAQEEAEQRGGVQISAIPAVEFDWHSAYGNIQAVRPGMPVFRFSAKTGDGMDDYLSFLLTRRDELRALTAV